VRQGSQLVADESDEALGLGGVGLEKGRAVDLEAMAKEFFVVVLLAGGDVRHDLGKVGLHHDFASLDAASDGDLVEAGGFALEPREEVVDPGVGDLAVVDAEEAMGTAADEADLAAGLGGEADVVTVTPGVIGAESGRDGRVLEVADAPKLVTDDVPLEFELVGVVDVLPLAAAAFAEVATGGITR
jgi:hypothetical protein